MESAELIVGSVAVLLGSIGLVARYLLARLIRLERDSEAHRRADLKAKDEELSKLRLRVADLEERAKRVPILESQVSTLLAEMSTLQQKVRVLSEELEAERDSKAKLERDLADVRAERERLQKENHDLRTANGTYERALTLLGLEHAERSAKKDGNEGEPQTGEAAPEQSAQSEETG